MNPIAWIKNHFVILALGIVGILSAIIQSLRLRAAKVDRDLKAAEARQIKRTQEAQKRAREQTSEMLDEVELRHTNNTRRDID